MNRVKEKLRLVLGRAETYFKTDMTYLAKGSFWLVLGQGASTISSFVLSIAFAHFLSQEAYGNYKYILSLASIIGAVSLTGLTTAVAQSTSRGYEGTVRYAFRTSLKWSIPLVVTGLGIGGYYLFRGNILLASGMAVAALFTPLINGAQLYGALLSGKKLFRENSICWAIGVFFSTAMLLSTMAMTQSVIAIVGAYFASNALAGLSLYWYALRRYPENSRVDENAVPYSAKLSAINFLNAITSQVDKVLVFHYLGAAQVAIYAYALAVPDQIRAMLKSAAYVALPKFAERPFEEIRRTLLPKMSKFGLVILVATLLYIPLAPFIYELLFPRYIESVAYSQLFALTILTVLGNIPLTAFQAHAKERELYVHTISLNIIQIAVLFVAIRWFGLLGAVTAVIINRFLFLLFPTYLFSKIGRKSVPQDEGKVD